MQKLLQWPESGHSWAREAPGQSLTAIRYNMYSTEPIDTREYTRKFDQSYTRLAKLYDVAVKWLPIWRNWIAPAIPHILGPCVLEVSFGAGYLLTQYAHRYETYGIDYNWALTRIAKHNLAKAGAHAAIQQADIAHLPYRSETFNTAVNTMAFTGYPDGSKALTEIRRVLQPNGRFVLLDINYPHDRNWIGVKMTRLWASTGDIIRDMGRLFEQIGFRYQDEEVGGFGSVHLYVATKIR